jgi:Domain of unknown function (DUF4265)
MAELATEGFVKIRFELNAKDWKGLKSESLWALEVRPAEYLIRNSPFYIYGISTEDTVHAKSDDGILRFAGVAKRGGHSTYRILLRDPETIESPRFRESWQPLRDIGCTYELAKTSWLSVDIPPATGIVAAYRLLENGESKGIWTFEEAHCGHPVNRGDNAPC